MGVLDPLYRQSTEAFLSQFDFQTQERLKRRISQLSEELDGAEAKAAQLAKEVVSNEALADGLLRTLRATAEARDELTQALGDERDTHVREQEELRRQVREGAAELGAQARHLETELELARMHCGQVQQDLDYSRVLLQQKSHELEAAQRLYEDSRRLAQEQAEALNQARAETLDALRQLDVVRAALQAEPAADVRPAPPAAAQAVPLAPQAVSPERSLEDVVAAVKMAALASVEAFERSLEERSQQQLLLLRRSLEAEIVELQSARLTLDEERRGMLVRAEARSGDADAAVMTAGLASIEAFEKSLAERSQQQLDLLRRGLEEELSELQSARQALDEERRVLLAEAAARSRRTGPGRKRRALLLVTAVAAVAGACWALMGVGSRDYAVPFSHASALVWQGDSLWAADWLTETVFRLQLEDGRLRVARRYPLPGIHITGMTLAGGFLYTADPWSDRIEKRRLDDALSVERSWPSPGPNLSALAFDGRYLLSAAVRPGRIYQQALDDNLEVLNTFSVPAEIIGMAAGSAGLLTADSASRLVRRHRADSALSVLESFGLSELDNGAKPFASFTQRQDSVWFGREGSAVLHQRPLRRFSRRR